MIHLRDKMPDAISRLGDALIVIEMNFFLFERADESFSIPVLPRASSLSDGNLNAMSLERFEHLKDTARLDPNDESQGRCGRMPLRAV